MNEVSERLLQYSDRFSPAILRDVNDIAVMQKRYDYPEYFDKLGIPEPQIFKGHSILDIRPKHDHDESKARVFHYPMGNPNDPNMIYQAATVFATAPYTRLICIGNASMPRYKGGGLNHADRKKVAHGDLRPTVDPVLDYLEQESITTTEHIGYSYGATKAAVAIKFSQNYDQEVTAGVHIEPADVKKRKVLDLGESFDSTSDALQGYVDVNNIPAFVEARKKSVTDNEFKTGLLRPTNLAITRYLCKGLFEANLNSALEAQSEMTSTVIWGSESELAIDGLVADIVQRARGRFSQARVESLRLKDQKHAFPNDIHLLAATVLWALGTN